VLLACVHAADLRHREGARLLVETTRRGELPRLELVGADQDYTGALVRWLEEQRDWHLQVVRHPQRQLWRYGLEEKPPRRSASSRVAGSWNAPSPAGRPAMQGSRLGWGSRVD
jgi:hypothetical protein